MLRSVRWAQMRLDADVEYLAALRGWAEGGRRGALPAAYSAVKCSKRRSSSISTTRSILRTAIKKKPRSLPSKGLSRNSNAKACAAAQWLWNAAMNANPIGQVVTGIAGLVTAGYYLYKYWDDIKERWVGLWVKIKKKAAGVIDWFKALPDKIPGWIADIGKAIGDFGATLKEKFFGWIGKIPDDFVDMVKGLPQALKESMAKFGAWVKEQLKDMFTFTFDLNFFGKQTAAGADPNRPLVSAPKGYSGAGLRRNARGGVYSSPTLSLIGEGDSPEYVIPVQGQHKRRGLALWQAAGRDLGVSMLPEGHGLNRDREKVRRGDKINFMSGWRNPLLDIALDRWMNAVRYGAPMSVIGGNAAKMAGYPEIMGKVTGGAIGGVYGLTHETAPIQIQFSPQIILADSSQKDDVIEAMKESIKILEEKLKELAKDASKVIPRLDPRLSF